MQPFPQLMEALLTLEPLDFSDGPPFHYLCAKQLGISGAFWSGWQRFQNNYLRPVLKKVTITVNVVNTEISEQIIK